MKAAYDQACKKLLAHKVILAWILKYCVPEYKDATIDDIANLYIEGTPQIGEIGVRPDQSNTSKIIGTNTEDTSLTEHMVKYDIKFDAIAPKANGDDIRLIINIEAQNKYHNGYPLVSRGFFYGSRLLSAQYGTVFDGSHYEKLRKVYSIWVCLNAPHHLQNTIVSYNTTEECIYGAAVEPQAHYDLIRVIMIYLGDDDTDSALLNLLSVLLSNKKTANEKIETLQIKYHIANTNTLSEGVNEVCNLSDGIWDDGKNAGFTLGTEHAGLRFIRNLMDNLHMTFEQAADALALSEEDRSKYKKQLTK